MESKLIEFDNDGKIITATGNMEIKVENGIIIKSDKSILNKETLFSKLVVIFIF